jgi:benzaldehyde dehydrogenase (NAD)
MINGVARDRVLDLIDDAVERGARVLAGGVMDGPCLRPTVVAGVTQEMAIFYEETFAPVITIIDAHDDDTAIELANDTQYGLSAAVFGTDLARATKVARRIQSGICHINSSTVDDEPQMPFGGVKASGWGAFGGSASIEEFTQLRWVTTQEESRTYPI